jgi:hypothetical protein
MKASRNSRNDPEKPTDMDFVSIAKFATFVHTLKGVCHEIFDFRFIHESVFPGTAQVPCNPRRAGGGQGRCDQLGLIKDH